MSQLIPNSFSSYTLSSYEEEAGSVITLEQKQVIQNKLSSIAEQKLNLVFDPANISDYPIQLSYLQGQLDGIRWLLDTSVQVEEVIAARLASTEV